MALNQDAIRQRLQLLEDYVYRENIKGRDMTPPGIVRAIGNLLASGLPIANAIHVLNHGRYTGAQDIWTEIARTLSVRPLRSQ